MNTELGPEKPDCDALIDQFSSAIQQFVSRHVHSSVMDDVKQDTLTRVWKSCKKGVEIEGVGFAFYHARKVILSYRRKRNEVNAVTDVGLTPEEYVVQIESSVEANLAIEELHVAMENCLSRQERKLVTRHFLKGVDLKSLQSELQIDRRRLGESVKKCLTRLREALS